MFQEVSGGCSLECHLKGEYRAKSKTSETAYWDSFLCWLWEPVVKGDLSNYQRIDFQT